MSATADSPDPVPPPTSAPKRSIHSYYDRKVGLCQTASLVLNAGLMVYAHVGLSGVILSSFDPAALAAADGAALALNATCGAADRAIWTADEGEVTLPTHAEYCLVTGGCLTNRTCTEACFQERRGYSADCARCFGALPQCGFDDGCTLLCIADGAGAPCRDCLVPCMENFYACSAFPEIAQNISDSMDAAPVVLLSNEASAENCNDFDLAAVPTWYNVYNLTFVGSVRDSWNNDARLLSFLIVFFSGFWPYAKNVLLLALWFTPLTIERQTWALLWLSRLSKYTLVDVFAVIGMLVGVQLQLDIGGVVEATIRAEPRFSIICFFLATAWEFAQIEVIKAMHERKVSTEPLQDGGRLLFSQLWVPVLLLLASVGLFVAGTVTEFIFITSADGGGSGTCLKSFSIVQLGNALVSETSLTGNGAAGQTWFLYLVYVVLTLALPLLAHAMQLVFLVGRGRSRALGRWIQWTSAVWCASCVEVLAFGTFAIESKFEDFVKNVGGISENTDLFDVKSGLGAGFYVLVAYSVVACVLQFSLGIRRDGPPPRLPKSADADERGP